MDIMKTSPTTKTLRWIGYGYAIVAPIITILFPQLLVTYPIIALILTPSWVALVGKILYDNNEQFYFWFTKTWLKISRSYVDWSLSVKLKAPQNPKVLNRIKDRILQSYPDAKIWHNDDFKKIIELPIGCTLKLEYLVWGDGLEAEQTTLHFTVSEQSVPFNKSERISEHILSIIDDILLPESRPESQQYVLRVKFGEDNPYFGVFVRKLRLPDQKLASFRVEYYQSVGHKKEKVEVGNKEVAVITDSLPSLQSLSQRFITLASLDLTNQ
jgi:hypothetical protein